MGLDGLICPPDAIPEAVKPGDFAVFSGILPEGRFDLVKAFQKSGHAIGICGDGANYARALRRAQIGIAISTAAEVGKSAAGMVLTKAGLPPSKRAESVPTHPHLHAQLPSHCRCHAELTNDLCRNLLDCRDIRQ